MTENSDYWADSYWGGGYWAGGYFGAWGKTTNTITADKFGLFEAVIAELSKRDIGKYVFEAGCVEPGIDNAGTLFRREIKRLKGVKSYA